MDVFRIRYSYCETAMNLTKQIRAMGTENTDLCVCSNSYLFTRWSKHDANVLKIHVRDVCSKFASSCKRPISLRDESVGDVAEADSRQIASQSQFLGVQLAAVMLFWLLVGVERRGADVAVNMCPTPNDLRVITPHCRLSPVPVFCTPGTLQHVAD